MENIINKVKEIDQSQEESDSNSSEESGHEELDESGLDKE